MKPIFSIIVSSFNYGGIEVLVERMARSLSIGFDVEVYILTDKYSNSLLNLLDGVANVYLPSDIFKFRFLDVVGLNIVLPVKSVFVNKLLSSDYVHVTDSSSLSFIKFAIQDGENVNLSVGNYQSEEYIWNNNSKFRNIDIKVLCEIPDENIFSTNFISKKKLIATYKNKFENSRVMPAGIEIPSELNEPIGKDRRPHLVIVGRLVKFKSYIEHTINDINNVLYLHPEFQLHIYGDGPERSRLEYISKGLPVFFHGTIDLDDLNKVISSSKVFLGSGTSILTASALGVPSIIGIESSKNSITYGFLHDVHGYDYQELGLKYTTFPIYTKVNEILNMNYENYRKECLKARNKAKEFDVKNTANELLNIKPFNFNTRLSIYYKITYFLSYMFWSGLNKIGIKKDKVSRHYIEK